MELNYKIALTRLAADSADKKVLELLSAIKGFQVTGFTGLSAKQLLIIAKRLGITEASMRMALSRQKKQGKLIRENGKYALAKSRDPFVIPRFWLDIKHRTAKWNGDWLLVNQGNLKFNSTTLRRLNSKATLLGFKAFQSLGWLRPNNVVGLREETLFHFHSVLGETGLCTSSLSDVDELWQHTFMQSWPAEKLNQLYLKGYELLASECELLSTIEDDDVLLRSFAIGRLLVEYLSNDPWLPEEIVDVSLRTQLVDKLYEYYQKIMPAWQKVIG